MKNGESRCTRLLSTQSCTLTPQLPGLDGRAWVTSSGSDSTELAKMIGITPDWLTLSGM